MSSRTYTGPSVADMIRDQTLAENVIQYRNHPSSDSILDDSELSLLQRFVEDPTGREQILKDKGIDPNESLKGKQTGLVAYAVWAHGRQDMNGGVLKQSDFELLRKWFRGGMKAE